MSWWMDSLQQYSIAWIAASALMGGIIGSATKFLFEDILRPMVGWRRDAQRLLKQFTVPLLKSTETLERQINNLIRNAERGWYESSEYYRLSTLYTFAEYLGWVRIIERRFGYVDIDRSRGGRKFNRQFYGFYRALCSFGYFRWSSDVEKVIESSIPRRIFTAIGEVMILGEGENERIREFSDFCIKYVNDDQFRRWFNNLHEFLRNFPEDDFRWDRLIAAGANLRALSSTLDTRQRKRKGAKIANMGLTRHLEVRRQLERQFVLLIRD